MTENPAAVIDMGLSGQLKTELRVVTRGSIPLSFEDLILWVTADLGPPVSYVKTAPGTRLVELTINKKVTSRSSGKSNR